MHVFRGAVGLIISLFGLALRADQLVSPVLQNGSVVAQSPCTFTPFEEQSAFTKRFYSKDEYQNVGNNQAVECLRIQYLSDGLKVIGYLVKPRDIQAKRYPLIVYNRGGFLESGKVDASNLLDFYGFAARGFVVLASQYRGNDGGEGHDEVGGADLNDVVSLWSLATALPYVDARNVFVYGVSRGGMMTFLALKRGVQINAAAVVGAVYDLEAFSQRSPGVARRATALMPDFANRGAALLRERSAMNWPDQINVPLLMIHGANDDEVPASEALLFASRMADLKKAYELIVYANDIHEAAQNRVDRDARILAWFRRYLR